MDYAGRQDEPSLATDRRSMDAAACPVLTIGHSRHLLEAFVALLRRYEVTKVIDVRYNAVQPLQSTVQS